ncbi:hydrogenase expression protein HypE [Bradyrhizobium sp. CCBAU 11386]|uniref:hydrogenase large subunit n=1 Tax=Bradyrhizobium sp. CCBAU 11386 TaxID=1630837 RepID=UPI002303F652|nr:NADH-quinone oxidoreductase subunit C [Bradyrhizobium sp. CCBAU 11386]MDA9503427.1 hydrogenase expression protein HypE [Bradyrhizobium sp. CCBAU 11386]
MPSLIDLMLEGHQVQQHSPWPRATVDASVWVFAASELAHGRWSLLGLWGEPSMVHMAIMDGDTAEIATVSLDCPDRTYPSVGRHHPPALRLERVILDLFGLSAEGSPDSRPWLDHNNWGVRFPLGDRIDAPSPPSPYRFLPVEGDGLHEIAVGPVHAGIIEPGHFRFTASGETVVRLEQRLGYTHKGIEGLMTGANLERAVQLAGRVSGDSTVAYAFAFSRAAEAALQLVVPDRAIWLRALLAELERLANHLGDIGAICNDASFALMQAHCAVLRESILRASNAAFGHRLMRDIIVPGGVTRDLNDDGTEIIQAALGNIRRRFPALVELYDNTASLQDRTVDTGVLKATLARQYAAGGYVGRASGRSFDARRTLAYPPYDSLHFEVPVLNEGDVNARVWIRVREVEQSLSLINQILDRLPEGPMGTHAAHRREAREGMAIVEGFRGDVLVWLRLRDGRVERCHLRDPSWFQWPLLEAAIEGNIVADFPLCNKSFNCSYSGHDL